MTPFTVFTSYRREDADAVSRLESQLRLRGVRSWRDVRKIQHGAETVEQIRRAIRTETQGFLAYITTDYLTRREGRHDVVWEVELPEAATRWKAGGYGLTPLFCGVDPSSLTQACLAADLPDLAAANGLRVPLVPDQSDAITRAAEATAHRVEARAQLANALAGQPRSVVIAFHSFSMPSLPNDTRLDLDWAAAVDGATPEEWEANMLPALRDVRDALGEARITRVDVHVLARLNAALALGLVLPLATGIEAAAYGRHGEPWPPSDEVVPAARPLRESSVTCSGDPRVAVLDLSIVADLSRDAATVAAQVRAQTIVRLATETSDRNTDPRTAARAIATQVGDAARALRAAGVNELHVLMAAPAPLAFLVGRQLHAIGSVSTYFSNPERAITRAFTVVA